MKRNSRISPLWVEFPADGVGVRHHAKKAWLFLPRPRRRNVIVTSQLYQSCSHPNRPRAYIVIRLSHRAIPQSVLQRLLQTRPAAAFLSASVSWHTWGRASPTQPDVFHRQHPPSYRRFHADRCGPAMRNGMQYPVSHRLNVPATCSFQSRSKTKLASRASCLVYLCPPESLGFP